MENAHTDDLSGPFDALLCGRRDILARTAGVAALIAGGAGPLVARGSTPWKAAGTSRHTLHVGPRTATSWVRNDTNAGIDQDSAGLTWMILGTTDWAIYSGRSMDTMRLSHIVSPAFPKPHGDDKYWPSGLWIDRADGTWYCPVHCEYNYGRYAGIAVKDNGWSPDHRRRMLLATSIDQGRNWTLVGDILTGHFPEDPRSFPGDYYDKGVGDGHVYIDDEYFWAFYRTGWFQKSTGKFFQTIRAARSRKRDRMQPGTWRKWFGGDWREAGLGGRDSDVFNAGSADTAYVFYSMAIGRYVALIGAGDIENPQGYLSTCTNLARQDWAVPMQFADAKVHEWYNWAIDPATNSRHVMRGRRFRYYTSTFSAPGWAVASFAAPPSHPVTTPPLYPPDSVNDPNAGWNRSVHSSRGQPTATLLAG